MMIKKILLIIICVFVFSASYSQKKSKNSIDSFYNAFMLSKELVAKGKTINENASNFSIQDKERLLSYLVWYANTQDYGDSSIGKLDKVLKKYTKLNELYIKLYGSVSNIDFLYNLEPAEFEVEYVQSIPLDKKYANVLLSLISNYNQLKDDSSKVSKKILEKEREIASLKAKKKYADSVYNNKDIYQKNLEKGQDSILEQKVANDVKIWKGKKDTLNVLVDSINEVANWYKKSKSVTIAALVNKRREIDLAFSADENQKRLIVQKIQKLQVGSQHKKLSLSDESILEQVKQIQYAHEVVLNEAQQSTLQFKLPSQTEMIDALAIYLAKRVKQESVMWFFETIKKNAENYDLIKTFFPATLALLQSNEVYEIPNLGTQWRYALSKDFVKMPRNVLGSDWIRKWFPDQSEEDKLVFEYINTGFDISDLLLQRYSYRDLVRQIYLQTNSATTNLGGDYIRPKDIFSLLYGINEECFVLSQIDTTYRMLQYEDFRLMNKDEIEVMLSLIDMKYGGSFIKLYKSTGANFEITNDQVDAVRKWLGSIEIGIGQFKKIQSEFNQTQADIKNGKKEDAVYSVFNLWESVNTLFDLVIPDSMYKPTWMHNVTGQSAIIKKFTKNGFEVYNQISLKNYAGATNSVLLILEELFYYKDSIFKISTKKLKENLSYSKTVKKVNAFYPAYLDTIVGNPLVKKSGYVNLKRNTIDAAVVFERERHAIQLIRKLSGFLNDVMLTKEPKQLAKVVESYALPPGSYKRKRNSWWSLDVNAYVGIYGGYEIARKSNNALTKKERSEGWVYGITAPIGISLSRTFGKRIGIDNKINDAYIRNPDKLRVKKNNLFLRSNSTFTLSVNIIDIGAVVSYRFNNTQDSILPQQLKWEQVISPGIHVSYGIKNTPLAISAGYQYTPLLRRIGETETDKKTSQFNTSRIQLGLLFDLRLANIWQLSFYKPKLKKRE